MNKTPHEIKKIGVYDSGLGGLFVLSKLYKVFPGYDYVFIADEKNLPYGTKTIDELFVCARKCIDFLFNQEKCDIVIIACNTLSATVYETLQNEYRNSHKDQLLIDIITPTIDSIHQSDSYVVFGTPRTVESHLYRDELQKRFPKSIVVEFPTTELASLIEKKQDTVSYLSSIKEKISLNPTSCIFGCTHYGIVENSFKKVFPFFKKIVRQDTVLIDLMRFMLQENKKENGKVIIFSTALSVVFGEYAKEWFGDNTIVNLIEL